MTIFHEQLIDMQLRHRQDRRRGGKRQSAESRHAKTCFKFYDMPNMSHFEKSNKKENTQQSVFLFRRSSYNLVLRLSCDKRRDRQEGKKNSAIIIIFMIIAKIKLFRAFVVIIKFWWQKLFHYYYYYYHHLFAIFSAQSRYATCHITFTFQLFTI